MFKWGFKSQDMKYLPAVLVVLLIGILLIGPWSNDDSSSVDSGLNADPAPAAPTNEDNGMDLNHLEIQLEKRLEGSLSQIKGVGEVKVTVLLASGPKYDYAVNVSTNKKTTDEKDQSGGTRTTTEITEDGQLVILRSNQNGEEMPVVAQEYTPEVQGVLVIAEGADNPNLKRKLISAVQTILNLEVHKIDIQCKKEVK